MTRISVLIAIVLAGAVGRTAPGDAVSPAALGDLFKPGGALQDRNGDGAIDFVDARIVLADEPTAGELAAAADVAARLGYETSAMNLPVPRGASADDAAFSIYIGAKALAQAGASADAIGVGALKGGDGAVASFVSGGRRGVALVGGDEAGLESAAVMLGGHLPYVGDQKSATTDKIADEVRQALRHDRPSSEGTASRIRESRSGFAADTGSPPHSRPPRMPGWPARCRAGSWS